MYNLVTNRTQGNPRTNAIVTGFFFIMASTTAIIGLKLYDPVLVGNSNYLQIAQSSKQAALGAFFELLLVCSNIGTGIMLFPYLKLFNERLGLGYIFFRFLEALLILVGIISVLALTTLSSFYANNLSLANGAFVTEAVALKAIHDWTFILGPHFVLGINTFIYSYVFFKSRLIPQKLALWGLIGAVLIFAAANLELFDVIKVNSGALVIMALPIALYEMVLAGWLIVKGFNFENIEFDTEHYF